MGYGYGDYSKSHCILFLLLQMQIRIKKDNEDDSIQPLELYAQLNHKRDEKIGAMLEGADLNVRQSEIRKADLFGVSDVELYEEVDVGRLSIEAMTDNPVASE